MHYHINLSTTNIAHSIKSSAFLFALEIVYSLIIFVSDRGLQFLFDTVAITSIEQQFGTDLCHDSLKWFYYARFIAAWVCYWFEV